jgi:hypothetical protein
MKPDAGLIVAVRRNQTGAHIHKINNLLNQYVLACHTDNRELADRARHALIGVVSAKHSRSTLLMK